MTEREFIERLKKLVGRWRSMVCKGGPYNDFGSGKEEGYLYAVDDLDDEIAEYVISKN